MSTKSNQRSRVQIHLLRKNKPTSGQSINSDLKNKVCWQTSEETKTHRDMWQKWCVLKKMCRMETSFLISLTLVSNNNYWNPRKLHDQLRVTLTHTPALPTQWTKRGTSLYTLFFNFLGVHNRRRSVWPTKKGRNENKPRLTIQPSHLHQQDGQEG